MTKPVRLQRRRTQGFKLVSPNGLPIICVDRTTKWGNPFTIGQPFVRPKMQAGGGQISGYIQNAEEAVHFYRRFLTLELQIAAGIHLRGKNLACWCPLTNPDGSNCPCHADILLEMANA